jgi:GNAT superfamily N-acetyltransferase
MSTPPSPYSTGSERDQQVRARLSELGEAAGIPLEEILQQLAKASSFGVDLPANLAALVPEASAPGSARVVRQRPGDEEWGVETRIYEGVAAQPRPCSGEKVCPWRRDAPVGQFPPEVYVHSAPGNRTGGPSGRFGCHSSTAARPLLCAGWLLAGADGNAEVLSMMDAGVLARPELPDGVEVYDSYAEMAAANGVDPGLPALHARPTQTQDPADLVPLQRFFDDHYAGQDVPTAGWTGTLTAELKRSMPPDALLGLVLAADDRALELQLLRVSGGHRGQGHATRVLARLCDEADARSLTVVCTPTDEHGADRPRLEALYRRFGFTPVAPERRLSDHTWERPPHTTSTPTALHEEP